MKPTTRRWLAVACAFGMLLIPIAIAAALTENTTPFFNSLGFVTLMIGTFMCFYSALRLAEKSWQ